MTLEAMAMRLASAYEKAILQAQSPGEVGQLREELGEVVELLRTVGVRALAFEDVLKAAWSDDRRYRLALETAGDPHASWPPPVVVRLQPGERL